MNLDLSKINTSKILSARKVFFIGIGGIGISALAKMCLARGMEVSGVNDEESLKTLKPLEEEGAHVFYLDSFKLLPEADLYVYSDAWIYRGPEILESAKATGKPVMSYFEALGEFAKEYKVIAISGTHGKTTTTAMVAELMVDAGLDPTVIVGSFIKKFNSNFRKGSSEYLVVEADEYNRHFLQFHPYIGAVTNIEADHLDCYKNLADIQSAFDKFLSQSEHKITDYEKYLEKVPKLSVPGIHNRKNAALALAIADVLGIKEVVAQESLAQFTGTWRRLEKRGETKNGTIVYDDYAHHPTEIRASIEALRELYPSFAKASEGRPKGEKKITVVFQPHLYSRTKALFNDFAKSFKGADKVMLLPIYFAREAKDESVSSEKLAEAICQMGDQAQAFPDFKSAEDAVLALNLGPNDVFVTMGAGEAYKVADEAFKLDF
jgi:UDP-N-acetylmuramate--alanine ligase